MQQQPASVSCASAPWLCTAPLPYKNMHRGHAADGICQMLQSSCTPDSLLSCPARSVSFFGHERPLTWLCTGYMLLSLCECTAYRVGGASVSTPVAAAIAIGAAAGLLICSVGASRGGRVR